MLYGHDVKLPTETAFTRPWSPYLVDVDDHKMELTHGNSETKQLQGTNETKEIATAIATPRWPKELPNTT